MNRKSIVLLSQGLMLLSKGVEALLEETEAAKVEAPESPKEVKKAKAESPKPEVKAEAKAEEAKAESLKAKVEEPKVESPKVKAEQKSESPVSIDYAALREECKKGILEFAKKMGRESTMALLSKFGASKISEVKDEDLIALSEQCRLEG